MVIKKERVTKEKEMVTFVRPTHTGTIITPSVPKA